MARSACFVRWTRAGRSPAPSAALARCSGLRREPLASFVRTRHRLSLWSLRPVAFFLSPASGAPPCAAVDPGATRVFAGGYQLAVGWRIGPASGAPPCAAVDPGATVLNGSLGLLRALGSRRRSPAHSAALASLLRAPPSATGFPRQNATQLELAVAPTSRVLPQSSQRRSALRRSRPGCHGAEWLARLASCAGLAQALAGALRCARFAAPGSAECHWLPSSERDTAWLGGCVGQSRSSSVQPAALRPTPQSTWVPLGFPLAATGWSCVRHQRSGRAHVTYKAVAPPETDWHPTRNAARSRAPSPPAAASGNPSGAQVDCARRA